MNILTEATEFFGKITSYLLWKIDEFNENFVADVRNNYLKNPNSALAPVAKTIMNTDKIRWFMNVLFYSVIVISLFAPNLYAMNQHPDSLKTKVILLGTGTPYPSPTHSGPATAVVYGKRFFLFDAGAGVERRINAAKLPISGPEATFITHLHSDHTLGYPDLILTSWIMRRKKTLQVYGPHGLQRMTDLLLKAWSEDINIRVNGLEKEKREYLKVQVHEIKPGVVYDSAGVKISAIPVLHGAWKDAYGYRIDTPDRSIVISGDTSPCQALVKASRGVDVLVHEVYASETLKPENRPGGEYWPQYCKEYHTSDIELGKIANQAQPKLLVLTHIILFGSTDSVLVNGIRKGGYKGKIKVGKDLDTL
jgi:ribonuclease BN (tRNA processing enzyme)